MITITTYKKQGDGSDSWHIDLHDCKKESEATRENRVSRELVFEDPDKPQKLDMSNVDLSTMTDEQKTQLKQALGL